MAMGCTKDTDALGQVNINQKQALFSLFIFIAIRPEKFRTISLATGVIK